MNDIKYRWILYLISSVILITLCAQVYWNYKNYEIGKQQLINEVQSSIDKAVDNYYTHLAKNSSFNIVRDSIELTKTNLTNKAIIIKDTNIKHHRLNVESDTINSISSTLESKLKDSTLKFEFIDSSDSKMNAEIIAVLDSLSNPIKELSSKIFISFTEDQFSLEKVDSLFSAELSRKNNTIDYGITKTGFLQVKDTLYPSSVQNAELKVSTSSPYFLHNSSLTVHFSNITLAVFKKNLGGVFLSFLLALSIIASLLYLLKIIQGQKQLAEVKNDLISNITHEFKTPLATIGIAMEALEKFNSSNDFEKSSRYAKMSREQVEKLNEMVEKLLETATLDSSNLDLKFEEHNLIDVLYKLTNEEMFVTDGKTISFHSEEENLPYPLDLFHFENAINNIIDNAIKYGGDEISIAINNSSTAIEINITDTGNSLKGTHKKEIFEKFYRVPTGNTHNVKGFGIGLYYANKIIEKHGGKIKLKVDDKTTFNIVLPNV